MYIQEKSIVQRPQSYRTIRECRLKWSDRNSQLPFPVFIPPGNIQKVTVKITTFAVCLLLIFRLSLFDTDLWFPFRITAIFLPEDKTKLILETLKKHSQKP